MNTGRRERRCRTTASSSRPHGMTLFHPSRCSSRWKVSARDAGKAGPRDPGEELRPVEQLEPVHARRELRVARETLRQPARVRRRLVVVGMRCDQRGAGGHGGLDRPVDPCVDGDEAPEADRQGVSREAGVGVVVGELEPGQDEQAVALARPARLVIDLGEIGLVARGGDSIRRVGEISAANVIGDAEDVEPTRAIQVDERGQRERPVAPGVCACSSASSAPVRVRCMARVSPERPPPGERKWSISSEDLGGSGETSAEPPGLIAPMRRPQSRR
jgi:hypothetical protein